MNLAKKSLGQNFLIDENIVFDLSAFVQPALSSFGDYKATLIGQFDFHVNDNLKILAPLINVPFSEIDHSKRDKQQKGLKAKGSLDRDKVISRIVERHRRLVKKNPKKFKDYINNRMLS